MLCHRILNLRRVCAVKPTDLAAATAILALSLPGTASAQTFGDIFTDMRTSQLGPFADILGTISFVLGIAFGIMAVMAMIRRSRTSNDNSVEVGRILMLSIAAACMIAIPTFLNVGVASIFGTGADQSTVDGQLRSLN
ncbi:hypothetical protein [Litoreibacter roseus]|uniref:Type IV secretion system protein VirB2 n=1 Tax=Litoreibacter roseus TaxID=2601869 RepID=A0A6N6JKY7_9RHOB|nr:hypothetical protein [Litoreibacter roseus]GFE66966.1 hypothetical protein KIN_40400 [Litoreibacter roseus]